LWTTNGRAYMRSKKNWTEHAETSTGFRGRQTTPGRMRDNCWGVRPSFGWAIPSSQFASFPSIRNPGGSHLASGLELSARGLKGAATSSPTRLNANCPRWPSVGFDTCTVKEFAQHSRAVHVGLRRPGALPAAGGTKIRRIYIGSAESSCCPSGFTRTLQFQFGPEK